ncbi:uncharacterized protein V1510DRAFT_129564 [Dipodascopsis tothii]|uniref:uncharacterized protein n=1 Tax=Dipodascopsis tothii TaxID=44089 RepID=UPI0034CD37D8
MPKTVVAVGGGQAAGKTTVCGYVVAKLADWGISDVATVHLADYYTAGADPEAPECFDFAAAAAAVTASPAAAVLVEGTYALWAPQLRDLTTFSVYVDADADTRLGRLVTRDSAVRPAAEILSNYMLYAKPAMEKYVRPCRGDADVILTQTDDGAGTEVVAGGIYDRLTGNPPARLAPAVLRHNLLETEFDRDNERYYEVA